MTGGGLRIALLTPFPLDRPGGVESVSALLREVLEGAGHRVEVFDITRSKKRYDGLFDFRLFGQYRLARHLGALFHERRGEFDLAICNGIYGWNVDFPKAIVILHGNIAAYAAACRDLLGPVAYAKTRYLDSWFFTRSFRGKTLVVSSKTTGREAERYNGVRHCTVIGNAVDTEIFRPREDKKALRARLGLPDSEFLTLFVGRPVRVKGVDLIEKIAARLAGPLRIVAAGPEPFFRGDRILEKTGLSREEMPLLYAACDAFLLPSRYEGCSIALLEALSTGLPLAAGAVGTAADLREEDDALAAGVLSGRTPEEYAARIESLASMGDEERTRIGARGREYALREHGREIYGERYLALVGRVLRGETRTAYDDGPAAKERAE
ncbi:MAG: glycosyltransferase family 4 protein [Candidatus Eisenbacteria bacterium]